MRAQCHWHVSSHSCWWFQEALLFLHWSPSQGTVCVEFILFMPWRPWLQNYIKHCTLKKYSVFELKSYVFLPGRKEINYIESSTFLYGCGFILFLWIFKRHMKYFIIFQAYKRIHENSLNFLFQIMGHRMWCMFTSIRRPWGIGALYSIW